MNGETFCEHFAKFADAPNSIQKLRELIFQLAVQGKVVSQDKNAEPASVLFSKIQAERELLIARRAIRRSKPLPVIDAAEVPFEIPATWLWVRFDDVGDWGAGATPNRGRPDYFGGEIKWFKSGELNDAYIDDSEEKITELALKECSLRENQPGDVLVAMYGATIGKVAILNVAATTNQAVCACTCHTGVFNRYLFLMLKAFKPYFISNSSGAAQPNFSKEKIVRTPFPLPPLAEQRRIVAKVDQLLGLCDELAARQAAQREKRQRLVGATLDRLVSTRNPAEFPTHAHRLRNHFDQLFDTPTTIPQLRQTILQLALQGQLVPVRRNEEVTAETLLAMERERMSLSFASGDQPKLESEYAALRAAGPNQDGSRRYISARCICDFITKGTTPAASELMPQGDVPFLKVYNIVKNVLNFEYKPTFVRKIVHETELRRSKIQPGNVLMNLVGPPLGKVAVVTEEYPEWNCNQALVIFKPISFYDSKFLSYIIGCPATLKEILQDTRGTAGQDNISLEQSRNLRIPLVSLEYQRRFIAEVTELLSLCDALEAKLTQAESAGTQLLSAAVHSLLQN